MLVERNSMIRSTFINIAELLEERNCAFFSSLVVPSFENLPCMVCQVVHMSIWLTIGLPGIAELPTPLMGISSSWPNILRFGDCDGTLFQAIPISCYVTRTCSICTWKIPCLTQSKWFGIWSAALWMLHVLLFPEEHRLFQWVWHKTRKIK